MSDMVIIILVMGVVTWITRAVPFFLFHKKSDHVLLVYFAKRLPSIILFTLVVFSLKTVSWIDFPYGLYELVSIGTVILIHAISKHAFVSIVSGTSVYMVLQQFFL